MLKNDPFNSFAEMAVSHSNIVVIDKDFLSNIISVCMH